MPQIVGGNNISDSAQINPGIVQNTDLATDAVKNNVVAADAAIAYSKLNLGTSIVNADISASAAIVDTKLAAISTASKVSGAALTTLASIPAGAGVIPSANLPSAAISAVVGNSTRAGDAASGNQTIAHGLGAVPSLVRFTTTWPSSGTPLSFGVYDGTNMRCITFQGTSTAQFTMDTDRVVSMITTTGSIYQIASCTVDATNITLAWTRGGSSPTGDIQIMWEVYA